MIDTNALKKEVARLMKLHQECEIQIRSLMVEAVADHVHIQRVKKQKLEIKDQIQSMKNKLLPDILA